MFSFPTGTQMVQFPAFACTVLCIHTVIPHLRGVAPFGYPRVKAYWAARRGFSQPFTSFVASRCLGILRMLLLCSLLCNLTSPQLTPWLFAFSSKQPELFEVHFEMPLSFQRKTLFQRTLHFFFAKLSCPLEPPCGALI